MLTTGFISRTQVKKGALTGGKHVTLDGTQLYIKAGKVVDGPAKFLGKTQAEVVEAMNHHLPPSPAVEERPKPVKKPLTKEQQIAAGAKAAAGSDGRWISDLGEVRVEGGVIKSVTGRLQKKWVGANFALLHEKWGGGFFTRVGDNPPKKAQDHWFGALGNRRS